MNLGIRFSTDGIQVTSDVTWYSWRHSHSTTQHTTFSEPANKILSLKVQHGPSTSNLMKFRSVWRSNKSRRLLKGSNSDRVKLLLLEKRLYQDMNPGTWQIKQTQLKQRNLIWTSRRTRTDTWDAFQWSAHLPHPHQTMQYHDPQNIRNNETRANLSGRAV